MTRSPLLGLVLALSLAPPALAQEKASEPALEAMGAALVQAAQNKVLEQRFPADQAFKAVQPGRENAALKSLLRVKASQDAKGITVEVKVEMIGMGHQNLSYRFDLAGALTRIEVEGAMRGRKERVVGSVEGDELVVERSRNGKAEAPKRVAWRRDVMPMVLSAFVLPSLADQGLPKTLSGAVFKERSMGRSSMIREDRTLTFTKGPAVKEEGARYQLFHIDSRNDPIEARVYAEGPRAGLLHSLTIDYKKDRPEGVYVRISAEEAAKLVKDAPLLNNEIGTLEQLANLRWRQENAKRNEGKFTEELNKVGLEEDERTPGYLVLLRVSADGQKWLAVAAPKEPGKTGKRYFVTNQDGAVYSSDKEIPLNDECTLPEGLTKVR